MLLAAASNSSCWVRIPDTAADIPDAMAAVPPVSESSMQTCSRTRTGRVRLLNEGTAGQTPPLTNDSYRYIFDLPQYNKEFGDTMHSEAIHPHRSRHGRGRINVDVGDFVRL